MSCRLLRALPYSIINCLLGDVTFFQWRIGRIRLDQIRIERLELAYTDRIPQPIGCHRRNIPMQSVPQLLAACLGDFA